MFGRRCQPQSGGNQKLREWLEETPLCTLLAVVSIGLFVAMAAEGRGASRAALGWGTGEAFWRGEVWRLLVNQVHHRDFLHLFFNLWWVMDLGRALEREAGTARMVAFVLGAGLFTGLACELTIEQGAIGLSGVVYAIFGAMWVLRRRILAFREALSEGDIKLLLAWLFLCVAFTYLHLLNVANVGHFAGLLFGVAVGWGCRLWPALPPLGRAALFLPLLLFPAGLYYLVRPEYNASWHFWRAYHAKDPQARIRAYRRALALRPRFPEAEHNLAIAYSESGDPATARQGLEQLLRRNPNGHHLLTTYLLILTRQKDWNAMSPWIERLRSLDPERAGVFDRLREDERRNEDE